MPRKTPESRPRLWTEGRQHPPLDARSYALASVRLAREGLADLLSRSARPVRAFGHRVEAGAWRIPPDRLGRSGAWLPSHQRLGQLLVTGAEVLAQAARSILPEAPPPVAPPARVETVVQVAPARPRSDPGDPDLAAIRAVIAEVTPPRRSALPPLADPEPPAEPAAPGRMVAALSLVLGHGLLVLSVPYGAVRAALAHLNGQDLRELVDQPASA